MKENILQIHKSIMTNYDTFLEVNSAIYSANALSELYKNLCKNAADHASKKSHSDKSKIKAASNAAYTIAHKHLEGFSDEEYKTNFKAAYDTALRVELYRQFFGQNILEVYAQVREQNLVSLINTIVEDIREKINSEFSKFSNLHDSMTETELQIINAMKDQLEEMLGKLKENLNTSSNKRSDQTYTEYVNDIVLNYQIEAGRLIRSYQVKTESNEYWAPFLLNIFLLLTVIGTLPAIYSLGTKAVTGHYAYFDDPVIRQTPKEEMAPEDILLSSIPNTFFNKPVKQVTAEGEKEEIVLSSQA